MIVFKKIKYKNFLSTGNNFTEIELNTSHSTLLNGPSGSGKSTLLDALTFVLYGRPYRDINKSKLINNINQKECLVELQFSINENNYIVRRGIKPNIFEIYINDELFSQTNVRDYQKYFEDNILKINFKMFCQIIVLGPANFVPFMKLKSADRRTFIESILDLQIFSNMNVLLKQDISKLKSDISDNNYSIELCKNKISMQEEYNRKASENIELQIKDNENSIIAYKNENESLNNDIAIIDKEIEKINDIINSYSDLKSKIDNVNKIEITANTTKNLLKKKIDFFNKNKDVCPHCGQLITEDYYNDNVNQYSNKILEQNNIIDKSNEILNQLNIKLNKLNEYNGELNKFNIKKQSVLNKISNNIINISNLIDKNNKLKNTKPELEKLNEYKKELETLNDTKFKYADTLSMYNCAYEILKDTGVKESILNQYLPIINEYLSVEMDNMGIYHPFKFDNSFENVYVNSLDYDNYSAGESQRFDLAVILSIRQLLLNKAKFQTNLFLIDEVADSFLDNESTKTVINNILFNKNLNSCNIFMISHKQPDVLGSNIDRVLNFKKTKGFSVIE